MSQDMKIRWGWLRFMYAYTIVGAGGMGLGIIFAPRVVESMPGFPREDPVVFGITGGVYIAFAVMSVLGLRSPLKFAPVLMLQLLYKVVWLIGVVLPLLLTEGLPMHGMVFAAVFVSYVIGDLIAIPFRYIFSKD